MSSPGEIRRDARSVAANLDVGFEMKGERTMMSESALGPDVRDATIALFDEASAQLDAACDTTIAILVRQARIRDFGRTIGSIGRRLSRAETPPPELAGFLDRTAAVLAGYTLDRRLVCLRRDEDAHACARR